MSEKIEERVAHLLRKAESTTPEEAEALTAAAEKLIIKHGIDRARLVNPDDKNYKPDIRVFKLPFEGMWQTAHMNGFTAVVEALGLKALHSKSWDGTTLLWFIGEQQDIVEAVHLVVSLKNQSEVALKAWWKAELPGLRWMTNHQRHVEKRSFMENFGYGAARRIRAERRAAAAEAGTGTDLVLLDRRQKIEQWAGENLNIGEAPTRRDQAGIFGGHAGAEAGRNASFAKGVDQSKSRAVES
uniref:DUF2786 domain-containing protein n=1 Tax=Micrococcus phage Kurnik TaxID=3092208 RepID=A0AAU6R675_9CAUD